MTRRNSKPLTIPSRRVAVTLPPVAPPPLALAAFIFPGITGCGLAASIINAAANSAVLKDIFIAFSPWYGRSANSYRAAPFLMRKQR
jgi:hypothetical protein